MRRLDFEGTRALRWSSVGLGIFSAGALTSAIAATDKASMQKDDAGCPGENPGITLPPGFCATVFADNLGHARHMAVAGNGVVYVNTWSGTYYGNDKPPPGEFLVALKDTDGDGKADVISRFGETKAQGSAGGTGIALYNGALYAEVNDRIVRYRLPEAGAVPTGRPDTIVSGLPLTGDHPMHPFAINDKGELFVDVATATNSCQKANRTPKSPGLNPARSLRRAATSGATTPTGRGRPSLRRSAMPPASAMPMASRSIPAGTGCTPRSTAATSSLRTGRSSTSRSRARRCPPSS